MKPKHIILVSTLTALVVVPLFSLLPGKMFTPVGLGGGMHGECADTAIALCTMCGMRSSSCQLFSTAAAAVAIAQRDGDAERVASLSKQCVAARVEAQRLSTQTSTVGLCAGIE